MLLDRHGAALEKTCARILEVGYGSPSLIEALRRATGARAVALDVFEVPGSWTAVMPEIEFVDGLVPAQSVPTRRVAALGPYDLIYAQDVWKAGHEFRWGVAFDPRVSPVEYAAWLASMLKPGGRVAALNDFGAALAFNRADLESAGLVIAAWDERIPMGLDPRLVPSLRAKYGDRLGDLRYCEARKP